MHETIKKRMIADLTYHPPASVDAEGDYTDSAPISLKCYPETKRELIRTKDGNEHLSEMRFYFDGLQPIDVEGAVTYQGVRLNIAAAQTFPGLASAIELGVIYI